MTTAPIANETNTGVGPEAAEQLSEALAAAFATGEIGDLFDEEVFLDGHPPFWRFQLEGREAFAAWLAGYAPEGATTSVVRSVPTATGFVTEIVGAHDEDGERMTDRKIMWCEVRDGRISALTVYCSGDWNSQLRDRHGAETTLIRP